ncbi:MAG: 2-oxoacid:acceptor oxidoreductase family protein [Candidatus Alcyoniella australis]|nr:2-oxoacid:acceptor oxidoreductase family protein [Candidatus Alcyoniella australis]
MLIKSIFSGFGGQGVLFMGYCLANSAMDQGLHTTYLPSYGAEVRGGTANCTVAVSDQEIASPVASEPDFVVAMNNPSLLRFQNHLITDGTLFLNQDLVDIEPTRDDVKIVRVPAVTIATQLGNQRGMNLVMFGAMIKHTGLVEYEVAERVVSRLFREKNEKLVEPNIEALRAGRNYDD